MDRKKKKEIKRKKNYKKKLNIKKNNWKKEDRYGHVLSEGDGILPASNKFKK